MFSIEERKIFEFTVNGVAGKVDPIAAHTRFNKALEAEDVDLLYKKIDSKIEQEFWDGANRLVPGIAAMFRLQPFDEDTGEGVSCLDLMELWMAFLSWESSLKKPTGNTQSSSPSTDSLPADSGTTPARDIDDQNRQLRELVGSPDFPGIKGPPGSMVLPIRTFTASGSTESGAGHSVPSLTATG